MNEAERWMRATAQWHRRQAEDCEREADILALDGVDLSIEAIIAPCALTPGALFGEDG